jgi:tetratricopeptide (TPR) repeat protein
MTFGHWVFLLSSIGLLSETAHGEAVSTSAMALKNYSAAKTNYLAQAGDTTAAWKFSQACADWADAAENNQQRAATAEEGIAAGKFVTEMAPTNAAGFYYLALNYGELARTKTIGALSLVKKMEHALLKAIQLDPAIDHAGPERSLGMLYRDAPGRPASIGNKSKAEENLKNAIRLAPDYPDNYLSLLEAYAKWKDIDQFHTVASQYEGTLSNAKKKYSSAEWEGPWRDWEERWRVVRQKIRED